jgi:hypothetical protein
MPHHHSDALSRQFKNTYVSGLAIRKHTAKLIAIFVARHSLVLTSARSVALIAIYHLRVNMGRGKCRRSTVLPAPKKNKGGGSAKGSDERPASTYDHGDCVYMTATGRGVYILAASHILSLSLSQRLRLQGVPVLMSSGRDCLKRPTRRSTPLM